MTKKQKGARVATNNLCRKKMKKLAIIFLVSQCLCTEDMNVNINLKGNSQPSLIQNFSLEKLYDKASLNIKINKKNNHKLRVFEYFLSEIDLNEIDKFITWGKNPKEKIESTNTTYIRKYDNDICITMNTDSSEFRMPLKKFIKRLEQWKERVGKNPNNIIITQEGNNFNCNLLLED